MNRMEELQALRTEELPQELGSVLPRAEARLTRHQKHRRAALSPLLSLAAFFAVFTVLVNVSVTFARACGSVPVLGDLAESVALSPSVQAAVRNGAVQVMDVSQTKNGVTLSLRYLIADGKQLYLFYSVKDGQGRAFRLEAQARTQGGALLPAIFSSSDVTGTGLRSAVLDFGEAQMPDRLLLKCSVCPQSGSGTQNQSAADFSFPLTFDPKLTQQKTVLRPNVSLSLGGQNFSLTRAEVYPSSMRLYADGAGSNSAWLRNLQFYVTDETGRRFNPAANGITASGNAGSPTMTAFRCESPYFSGAKHLYLHVTGAELLDRSMRTVTIDLKRARADRLPQDVSLTETKKLAGGWQLTFTAKRRSPGGMYQLFESSYTDPAGNETQMDEWQTLSAMKEDPKTGLKTENPGSFQVVFTLDSYAYDRVTLSPSYSRFVTLKDPVSVRLK